MGGTWVLLDQDGNVILPGPKVRLEPTQPEPTEPPPPPPVEPPPPEEPGPPEEPEPPTPQPAPVPTPPPVVVVEPTPAPEPPSPTEPPPSTTTRHPVPTWLRGVSPGKVALASIVGLFHLFTLRSTAMALHEVLGWTGPGLAVGMELGTFVLLAGVMSEMPWRRWGVLLAFSAIKVYAGAYVYDHELGGAGSDRDLAAQSFAALQAEVFAPLLDETSTAETAATTAQGICDDELTGRSGSVPGRGRKAQRLCDEARQLRGEATRAHDRLQRVAPYFEGTADLDALGLYERAREVSGLLGRPAPSRDDYYRSPLFSPVYGVLEGKDTAIVAVVLALFIDLAGLVMGSGLHYHPGPDLPTRVVGARLWWRRLRAAWSGPLP